MASHSDPTPRLPSPNQPNQTLSPETSPNKRRKTLAHPPISISPPPSSSGDEFIIGDNGSRTLQSESQRCGICLSEEVKSVRGRIDSCDHYFCFVCIMEWAKVESRCPLCKRRFASIRRPPKDGVFLAERIVNVPVRDQVYHYFGNATVGPPDPYSNVRCTVCNSESEENFLLLCDLCDSASHTFCIGLGATVPEGDWFCHDCTVSKAEHENSERDKECVGQTDFGSLHEGPPAEGDVSIMDVVREFTFREGRRYSTTAVPLPNDLPSPPLPELGARTVRRCRNVHDRIRALRENWDAFRSGSLRFSPRSVNSTGNKNQRHNGRANAHDRSGPPHSTRCSSQHVAAQKGSSCDTRPNRSSGDVDKAWKMMDAAKSMVQAHESKLKNPFGLGKVNTPMEKGNANYSILGSSSKPLGTKDLASTGPRKQYQGCSPVKENDRHKSQIDVKQKQGIVTTKWMRPPSAQSPGDYELPSSRKETSVEVDVCHGNGVKLREGNVSAVSLGILYEHRRSACLIYPAGPMNATSNASHVELGVSSSSKLGLSNGKAEMEKGCAGTKSRKDDDAKSEIQSLVKLNLKVLIKDRKLGADAFKKIARLATHSILAACGLENPKPGVCVFPSSVCCHTNQARHLRMSPLMPSSCRECFYVFVKDVVHAIMVEKQGYP